jgi:hypothetical protein
MFSTTKINKMIQALDGLPVLLANHGTAAAEGGVWRQGVLQFG